MTSAGTAVRHTTVTRRAPSGSTVTMALPPALGEYRWYGHTRFTGPRVARQFFLAPAGRHRVIPRKILPGGRQVRRSFRGHDVVLFEAVDRSDAAAVWVGPFNEATTWFGGPGPDDALFRYLIGTAEFRDSAAGASLTPTSEYVRGTDTSVIGMNRDVPADRPRCDGGPAAAAGLGRARGARRRALAHRARPPAGGRAGGGRHPAPVPVPGGRSDGGHV